MANPGDAGALRHFWVRQEDGNLARALPVLVAAGGKRLAVQNQAIVESCSLQPAGAAAARPSIRPRNWCLLEGRTCKWGWPPCTSGATRTRRIVCAGRPAHPPSCTHAPSSWYSPAKQALFRYQHSEQHLRQSDEIVVSSFKVLLTSATFPALHTDCQSQHRHQQHDMSSPC